MPEIKDNPTVINDAILHMYTPNNRTSNTGSKTDRTKERNRQIPNYHYHRTLSVNDKNK